MVKQCVGGFVFVCVCVSVFKCVCLTVTLTLHPGGQWQGELHAPQEPIALHHSPGPGEHLPHHICLLHQVGAPGPGKYTPTPGVYFNSLPGSEGVSGAPRGILNRSRYHLFITRYSLCLYLVL